MKIQDAIEGYILDCHGRECSIKTIIWYEQKLGLWFKWMEQQKATDIRDISLHLLRTFILHLQQNPVEITKHSGPKHKQGQKRTPHTLHGYVQVIKTFCKWLYDEELLEDDPARRLRKPKVPQYLIKPFTSDHLRSMLDACNRRTPLGFRDYIIVLLLADTGIRLGELCSLRVQNVTMRDASGQGFIRVIGKGKREREVGVSPDVLSLLWKYIKSYRSPHDSQEDRLFLSFSGTALKATGVAQLLRRIKRRASIEDRRVSAHTFRHTFATGYLELGGDIHNLSLLLGHSEARTTEIYAKSYTSHQARRNQEKFSPVKLLGSDVRRSPSKGTEQKSS